MSQIELLNSNNYIVIPEFIERSRAIELGVEFLHYSRKHKFSGDVDVPLSASFYNFPTSLDLLCEKTKEVSDILAEPVLPTYSYGRVYHNGSYLRKHIDRKSCEISITLHLDGDSPWDIWINTPDGNPKAISLQSGDAMLYYGCTAQHWRQVFKGEYYSQFFLHYVKSRGPNAVRFFDNPVKELSKEQKLILKYNVDTSERN